MLSSPAARSPRWVRLRLAVLVALLGAGVVLAARLPVPGELLADAAGWGPWAPLAFAALYAVATLAPAPKGALSAVAGLLFGLGPGALVVWVGAVIGAAAAFWLGRVLGRDAVARLTRGRLRHLDEELARRGAWAVLVLRLVPLVPFTAVNYGSGLSAVRFPGYLLATAVGIVPGTLAYAALGAHGTDPSSPGFVVAVTALLALTAAGVLAARRRGGSGRGAARDVAPAGRSRAGRWR